MGFRGGGGVNFWLSPSTYFVALTTLQNESWSLKTTVSIPVFKRTARRTDGQSECNAHRRYNLLGSQSFPLTFLHCFGMIIPLLKDKHGDTSRLDMYRGITLSNAISKLFEAVLVIHYRAMIYNLDLKGTVVALMQFLLLMSRSGVL